MGHKLRGFVAQGVDGRKAAIQPDFAMYPPGSWVFTPAKSGWYEFAAWSPGGIGTTSTAGASGAFSLTKVALNPGMRVAIQVGRTADDDGFATNTTLTFPNGRLVTLTRAVGAVPGSASGGDINLSGTAGANGTGATGGAGAGTGGGAGGFGSGGSLDGGAGAPAVHPYRGGAGGTIVNSGRNSGHTPGGGSSESGSVVSFGGEGLVIVREVSIRR